MGNLTGLYLHIPFCLRKCLYCDFCSFPDTPADVRQQYCKALRTEIGSRASGLVVDTIYFGGGTPSILEPGLLDSVLDRIHGVCKVSDDAEITLEANPGTLTKDKLHAYRSMGFNRLSMGLQSMDDDLLKLIGRAHSVSDFLRNYEDAREAGFDNINADLIFALPGQTVKQWEDTLKRTLDLQPEHLSFYALQIEEGTPLWRAVEAGELQETDQEKDRDMYHLALDLLEEYGYEHYEISNAAKPGRYSRHNLKYWNMEDYAGLGLSAHSWLDGHRIANTCDLETYLKDPCRPVEDHKNTPEETISEYIFTGLRKIAGLDLDDFYKHFGGSLEDLYEREVERHLESGLLAYSPDQKRLFLTRKGLDLANTVMSDFV
ncbi:MAG: radical SAM family heme chaperone HemW [Clostridiales bacterium]|nr:radical SAM family heme chaperone HemW [Clostridiales bacterium]